MENKKELKPYTVAFCELWASDEITIYAENEAEATQSAYDLHAGYFENTKHAVDDCILVLNDKQDVQFSDFEASKLSADDIRLLSDVVVSTIRRASDAQHTLLGLGCDSGDSDACIRRLQQLNSKLCDMMEC